MLEVNIFGVVERSIYDQSESYATRQSFLQRLGVPPRISQKQYTWPRWSFFFFFSIFKATRSLDVPHWLRFIFTIYSQLTKWQEKGTGKNSELATFRCLSIVGIPGSSLHLVK